MAEQRRVGAVPRKNQMTSTFVPSMEVSPVAALRSPRDTRDRLVGQLLTGVPGGLLPRVRGLLR